MRAVLFAYQEIGFVCLEELVRRGADVAALITHPDDAGENIWFRSCAKLAASRRIPVHETEEVLSPKWPELVASYKPELIFSVMFRKMIPMSVLDCATKGAYNLHPSLLPKYRGRCPVNWALINGEPRIGLTLHEMVKRADAGAIVAQTAVSLGPDEDVSDAYKKLAAIAPQLFGDAAERLAQGKARRAVQDDALSTKFGGRGPKDGEFNWDWTARRIHNLVRAVTHPYPGAFFMNGAEKIFVWKTAVQEGLRVSPCGTVSALSPLSVSCGENTSLELLRVQPESGAECSGAEFAAQRKLAVNARIVK